MSTISRYTGLALAETERLAQAIEDILTTPIGSRVQRRQYGSYLFELIDQPANLATLQKLKAACVDALKKWEPVFKALAITISLIGPGTALIEITGDYDGEAVSVSVSVAS